MSIEEVLRRVNETIDWEHENLRSATQRNDLGATALHVVSHWGDVEAMKLLIDVGADINAMGENDETPLHAAVLGNSLDAVKLLVGLGAKSTIDNLGSTPIDIAKQNGSFRMGQYLRANAT